MVCLEAGVGHGKVWKALERSGSVWKALEGVWKGYRKPCLALFSFAVVPEGFRTRLPGSFFVQILGSPEFQRSGKAPARLARRVTEGYLLSLSIATGTSRLASSGKLINIMKSELCK